MSDKHPKIKTVEHSASDNEYLHKDFHGVLCYAIKYLDDNYGKNATEEYLRQVGRTYFAPLTEKLKKEGLEVLKNHWQVIFSKEGGEFNIKYEGETLVLEVTKCPAIEHLKKHGLFFTERYCMTTKIVNQTICKNAGYACSCKIEPGKGKCIQKFWRRQK
jgi:hypothetical protein